MISGTSSEFLGRKPLPRAVQHRPVVFIHGPSGVGKSSVAEHLGGESAVVLGNGALLDTLAVWVREKAWPDSVRSADALVLDGPCFLQRRPAVLAALQQLLAGRAADGRRTIVCEGEDGASMASLMDAVDLDKRASVVLRFPVGRGRRRFSNQVADELGVSRSVAKQAAELDPWSYDAAMALLQDGGEG